MTDLVEMAIERLGTRQQLCPPLQAWRPDDEGLLPHCVGCTGSIRVGQQYGIRRGTNLVYCAPCFTGRGPS